MHLKAFTGHIIIMPDFTSYVVYSVIAALLGTQAEALPKMNSIERFKDVQYNYTTQKVV